MNVLGDALAPDSIRFDPTRRGCAGGHEEVFIAMLRTLAVTAVLTALVGFGVGWFVLSRTNPRATETETSVATTTTGGGADASRPVSARSGRGKTASEAAGVVDIVQRFTLAPGDLAADRETPAVAVAPD